MAEKKKKEITVKTAAEKPSKRSEKKKTQPTVKTLPPESSAKARAKKKGGKKNLPAEIESAPAAVEKNERAAGKKRTAKPSDLKAASVKGGKVSPSAEEKAPAVKAAEVKEKAKIKVLFVCTGNTCRSAMAEFIFKNYLLKSGKADEFEVSGAGLDAVEGDAMSPPALQTLSERGINGVSHRAKTLTYELAEKSDLIVCMTAAHKRAIGRAEKLKTVGELTGGDDVPDPFGQTIDVYRRTADYLEYACGDVYDAAVKAAEKRERAD